ncbi:hypothetical protein FOZ61_004101 [Perkinsus olseni]|uniref:Mediator of RNA polymerase II transcription subunit 6 n=1 Tax=Perkinsus olseni TaxID=32597 RepID=A0A7J6LMI9_PEROL|nr:hypothetical protein FOZ61_004101 [Perkinsus olseni]
MSAPISSPTTPLTNQAVADKLSDMSFRFPQFLMAEGLHPGNVLEYFYQSPFYLQLDGPESLNDKVRKNELRPEEVPYTEGTVYELVGMNKEGEAGNVPLSIFVIQRVKQRKAGFRTGPGGQPVPCRRAAQQMFYIIAGNASRQYLGRVELTRKDIGEGIFRLLLVARLCLRERPKKVDTEFNLVSTVLHLSEFLLRYGKHISQRDFHFAKSGASRVKPHRCLICANRYKAPCLGRLLERQLTMAFTRVDDILNTCKETFGMSSSGCKWHGVSMLILVAVVEGVVWIFATVLSVLQGDDNELTEKALESTEDAEVSQGDNGVETDAVLLRQPHRNLGSTHRLYTW